MRARSEAYTFVGRLVVVGSLDLVGALALDADGVLVREDGAALLRGRVGVFGSWRFFVGVVVFVGDDGDFLALVFLALASEALALAPKAADAAAGPLLPAGDAPRADEELEDDRRVDRRCGVVTPIAAPPMPARVVPLFIMPVAAKAAAPDTKAAQMVILIMSKAALQLARVGIPGSGSGYRWPWRCEECQNAAGDRCGMR